MSIDKELALAIDFKKAPVELQALATTAYANAKALKKAQAQLAKDSEAVVAAQKLSDESAKAFRVALKAWEPGE